MKQSFKRIDTDMVSNTITWRKGILILLSACAFTFITASCGSKAEDEPLQKENKIPIKWYLASTGSQQGEEAVEEEVGRYLKEKYDMDIDFDLIMFPFAEYGDKMRLVQASGEEFDICFTSSWSNNYFYYANKGQFYPLNEDVSQELKDSILPEVWEGVTVHGQIYGIPSNQVYYKQNYVTVVKEYAEAYDLDISSVHKLSDLDGFFRRIKADHPDSYPLAFSKAGLMGKLQLAVGFENLAGEFLPGAIRLGDKTHTVVNQYELEEVRAYYELIGRWVRDGIIRQDAAFVSNNGVEDMKSGVSIASVNASFKPGIEVTEQEYFGGREVVFATLSAPWMTTESISASLNAVNAASPHPKEAIKLLHLVNSDSYLYNLLCFGIEGVHYKMGKNSGVQLIKDSGYDPQADWAFGSQYLAKIREGQEPDIWEQTRLKNQEAKKSPVLGFSFDTNPVNGQIAAVQAVLEQYRIPFETGLIETEKEYDTFLKKLKDAGCDDIIQEMNRQLNKELSRL